MCLLLILLFLENANNLFFCSLYLESLMEATRSFSVFLSSTILFSPNIMSPISRFLVDISIDLELYKLIRFDSLLSIVKQRGLVLDESVF